MAKFFSHWYNKALAALLVILGFGAFLYNSIRVKYYKDTPVMYGPPPTELNELQRKIDSLNQEIEKDPSLIDSLIRIYISHKLLYGPPPTKYHDKDSVNKMLNSLDNDTTIVTQESTNP
ncbi:MAG: hypothetical protein IJV06_01850 [Bacteroidaceae bacterium]|nr:hypothetical protein [Bacteroidaceae bacterium]